MANEKKFNKAIFHGTIVSIKGENGNGSMTLACPLVVRARRSGKAETSVRETYPTLSFNKNAQTKNILESFSVGDRVIVEGNVRSYLRMDENTGDTREIMNIYIDTIEHDASCMEQVFGMKGRNYPEAENKVFLTGELAGISKRTNTILTMRLDMSENGKRNMIEAIYYNAPASLANELSIGDTVNIYARVQTVDTKEHHNIRNYQSIVILDAAKAE